MSAAEPPELPHGIALAWGIAASPQRGPKREMSVEQIVETAIEIADAEGIHAVSMAAVASRLGRTPMSLYRYVSAKDDLLLLMQEAATGLPPDTEGLDWREALTTLYNGQVAALVQHPWILSIPISGAPATPNSSAWVDRGLAALDGTPLSEVERLATVLLIMSQSRLAGGAMAGYAAQAQADGLDDAGFAERESALFDSLITADDYPALRRAIDAGVFTSEVDPFAFGLQRSLDGIAAHIAASGSD